MLDLPLWLHDTLALAGVGVAATWLVLRLAHVGRPREVGCSRCPGKLDARAAGRSSTGVRSKRLRVIG